VEIKDIVARKKLLLLGIQVVRNILGIDPRLAANDRLREPSR
jgi:hypothetical protein